MLTVYNSPDYTLDADQANQFQCSLSSGSNLLHKLSDTAQAANGWMYTHVVHISFKLKFLNKTCNPKLVKVPTLLSLIASLARFTQCGTLADIHRYLKKRW